MAEAFGKDIARVVLWRAQFIRVDPFRLGQCRVREVRRRVKGKDSCRSTKQLILSPGGIFYRRYNLQDASLKATRVYQRKPPSLFLPCHSLPPPLLPTCFVSSLLSFPWSSTLPGFLPSLSFSFLTAPEVPRHCNFSRGNSIVIFIRTSLHEIWNLWEFVRDLQKPRSFSFFILINYLYLSYFYKYTLVLFNSISTKIDGFSLIN